MDGNDAVSSAADWTRLRRVSLAACVFSYGAAILMILGLVWLWCSPDGVLWHARHVIGATATPDLPTARGYWGALAAGIVPVVLFVLAMLRLARLFRRFATGDVLDEANAGALRRIGWLLVAFGAATPIFRAVQGLALTFDNPPGRRQLAVMFDPGMFGALAAGAVLVAFGLVLGEAVRLADENQSFV